MRFNFKAKNSIGEIKEGVVEAASRENALAILQKNNLFPVRIDSQEKDSFSKIFLSYYDRVSEKELVVFFRQLAVLIEAKVPIVGSLVAISEQMSNKYFNKVLDEVIRDIEDGMTLSDAFQKHPKVFSNLSINIIRAGEASGNLRKSVEYVANNIEHNYELTSRVKSAMTYPIIVFTVFLVIGFLVVTFIIPKLTAMIKSMNADIPWYTTAVIGVGDFFAAYWWAVLIVILGAVGGMLYYLNTEEGKKEFDHVKIKLPIVGVIFRYVYITRFAENLSILLTGGIPIIKALTIVSSVIGNSVYEEIFLRAAEEVKVGGNMSEYLKRVSIIPPTVSHMIRIGEESGQIDSVLLHISHFYEQEVNTMTKNLSTLIEPVLMICIGIAVGFLAVAILMPIYNIAGQM
ncbi:MAG: type II secretion system F family protein [Candidatus Moranbacteria bacterium]|nr:type II secretion system F family protein [Candidatus Moranbacteria bacterium]